MNTRSAFISKNVIITYYKCSYAGTKETYKCKITVFDNAKYKVFLGRRVSALCSSKRTSQAVEHLGKIRLLVVDHNNSAKLLTLFLVFIASVEALM